MNIVVATKAKADLEELWHQIAAQDENPGAADRVLIEIQGAFALLSRFPDAGRHSFELEIHVPTLRQFHVAGHVIYYRERDGVLEVGRILHDSRDRDRAIREWTSP